MSTTDTHALTDAEIDDFVRRVYIGQGPRGLMMFCRQLLEANRERDLEAAALALAQPAPQGWRTIESVPKDGSDILVYFGAMGVQQVSWTDRDGNPASECAVWCVDDNKYGPYPLRGYCSTGASAPTHWMPLPPPPAPPLAGDGEKA